MKRALKIELITFFLMMCAIAQADDVITFTGHRTTRQDFSIGGLRALEAPQRIKVWDPHEKAAIVYVGFSLRNILDKVYGERWHQSELIDFVGRDGYVSSFSTSVIEQESGVLAFQKISAGGKPTKFSIDNLDQGEKNIPLGPLYLVWATREHSDFLAEGSINWPYQIIRISLWNFNDKFKNSLPNPDASERVHRGFEVFQKYCSSCHSINGDGGVKGGELLSDLNAHDDSWLRSWISNPKNIKPNTTMPALNQNLSNRDVEIENVVIYLRDVSASQPRHSETRSKK
jgi:mono/diheme cytochrome c family protein